MSDEAAAKARVRRLGQALRDNLRRRKGATEAEPEPSESSPDDVEPIRSGEPPR